MSAAASEVHTRVAPVESLTDERVSRQLADSLIISRIEVMQADVLVLGHALPTAYNSPERRQARAYFNSRKP